MPSWAGDPNRGDLPPKLIDIDMNIGSDMDIDIKTDMEIYRYTDIHTQISELPLVFWMVGPRLGQHKVSYIYIYIHMYICTCVSIYIYIYKGFSIIVHIGVLI